MHTIKQAFTLVELLVVVTILSILATISSLYFFENFSTSRDTSRKTSFNLMATNLELYFSENSKFPLPDMPVDIEYDGGVAWTQGIFGSGVTKEIKNFGQETPLDPLFDIPYSYSVTNHLKEYQIGGILEALNEKEGIGDIAFISQAHAGIETAFVRGNYNELMVRVEGASGTGTYIASPSIISTDTYSTGVIDIITNQKLVYNEFFNLPSSYSDFLDVDRGFNFNVSDPIVFSGSTQYLKSQDGMREFLENLQYIYSVTPTESFDKYISFIQDDGISKMKKFLEKEFRISFGYAFSCQDLFDKGDALEDGYYQIDTDGSGPLGVENIYCDIRNDNSAWTRVGADHLGVNGGDFSGNNHISTNYYSIYPSSSYNSIVTLTNPGSSSYVLHQTGTNTTNYEIHFDDFSQVKVGDEIRMVLWVSDNTDTWSNLLGLNPESGYMFHNRVYYTDGTFSSNGKVNVLETQNISGREWSQLEVIHQVRKQPQDFSWYVGLDSEDSKNLYVTGVELELYRH